MTHLFGRCCIHKCNQMHIIIHNSINVYIYIYALHRYANTSVFGFVFVFREMYISVLCLCQVKTPFSSEHLILYDTVGSSALLFFTLPLIPFAHCLFFMTLIRHVCVPLSMNAFPPLQSPRCALQEIATHPDLKVLIHSNSSCTSRCLSTISYHDYNTLLTAFCSLPPSNRTYTSIHL